jgi:hypothetical protein
MSPRLLRPRATGFNPKSISGLAIWLDASDRTSLYDATTGGSLVTADTGVGRWEDKSGNSRHFLQGVANNRPVFRTGANGRNGRSVLDFNGTSARLKADITALPQPYTILAVAAHDDGSGVQAHITDGATNRIITGKTGSNATAFMWNGTFVTSTANVFTSGTLVVITAFISGASSTLHSGGTQVASGNPGSNNFGGNGTIIGCNATEKGQFWDGHICEVLVYSKSLSTTERSTVESALGKKWGVTIA